MQVETLDERIAPAHLGLGALHAEIAQHRAALLARIEARVHSRAMHAHQMARLNHATSQVSSPVRVMTPTASAATPASSMARNTHAANTAHGAPVLSSADWTGLVASRKLPQGRRTAGLAASFR